MIITKTLLTEILLEVTNEEILHVAKETHRKATRGLLLTFPVYASSMLATKTLYFNLKRIRYICKLFKLNLIIPSKLGWLSGNMGVCLICIFNHSLLMHQERAQSNVFSQTVFDTVKPGLLVHGIEGPAERLKWLNKVSALTLTSIHL